MMCGNKIDLRQSFLDEGKTVITQESGEKLAKVGNIPTTLISRCIVNMFEIPLFYRFLILVPRGRDPFGQHQKNVKPR